MFFINGCKDSVWDLILKLPFDLHVKDEMIICYIIIENLVIWIMEFKSFHLLSHPGIWTINNTMLYKYGKSTHNETRQQETAFFK